MTNYFFTFFCLLSTSFFLFANDAEEFSKLDLKPSFSLASTEGLVSTIIDGSVSAITGEYIDSETDFVMPGPDPLHFQRVYSSSDYTPFSEDFKNELYQGWRLSLTNLMNCDSKRDKPGKKAKFYASVAAPSGGTLCYKRTIYDNHQDQWKKFHFKQTKGFTNCGAGKISAATILIEEIKGDQASIAFGKKRNLPIMNHRLGLLIKAKKEIYRI